MLYENVKNVLSRRQSLHLEDDFGIHKCWDELIELLGIDEMETINCLNLCTADEISWISEVFEDVAYKLQSKKYIECLKTQVKKHPSLDIQDCIRVAEEYLDD